MGANLGQAAFMVCLVLAIFAGVGIPWAWRLDRRDADTARNENQSEGTQHAKLSDPDS